MANARRKAATRWAAVFALAMFGFGGNASAILLDRGPDMVYDTVLDITWTRQAGDGGTRNWADANAWAAALVVDGFSGWRLPYASVSAGAGPTTTLHLDFPCDGTGGADETTCRDDEMAYMFYYNLDGNQGDVKVGTQTAVGGELLTGIEFNYWSGTAFNFSFTAWDFSFLNGLQSVRDKIIPISAWAVRDGDVCSQRPDLCDATAVPEPGSLLLLALGALGLGRTRRRKS